MSNRLFSLLLLSAALIGLAGCGGREERTLIGNWSLKDTVLGQEAGGSMVLQPDGKMIQYWRLEYQNQPGALDIHGKWEADEEKHILTITKTEVYWNQMLTEMPQLLGTETGPYRWVEGGIEWTREIGGKKVTTKLVGAGSVPSAKPKD
ncbi:MAG: hypothetical protein HRF45_11125 [Fimbriimonadia bacterium]|jgi:hypothetical protein